MEILKQSGPPRPMALTFQAAARIAPGRPTMKSSGYGAAGDKSPLNGGAFDVPGDKPDFIGCCFVARALHARAGGLGSEPTYRLCVTKMPNFSDIRLLRPRIGGVGAVFA